MLDFEKCKEIVQEVWGWQSEIIKECWGEERCWYDPNSKDCFYESDEYDDTIEKEVNSWEGFGRTVEAMEKHFADKNALDRFFNTYLVDKYGELYHWTSESLRDDTHLAALDAVRSEK